MSSLFFLSIELSRSCSGMNEQTRPAVPTADLLQRLGQQQQQQQRQLPAATAHTDDVLGAAQVLLFLRHLVPITATGVVTTAATTEASEEGDAHEESAAARGDTVASRRRQWRPRLGWRYRGHCALAIEACCSRRTDGHSCYPSG